MQPFKLVPFPATSLPNLGIAGEAIRSGNQVLLRYEVNGEVDKILLSARSPSPSRTDDLWMATCFEFFLALPGQTAYWEFNLSPSGDWNVYKMDAYRRVGFREETAFTQLPFVFTSGPSSLTLDLSMDLAPLVQPHESMQLGITAILQTVDGSETYWALTHPGPQADFHLREGFILTL